MQTGPIAPATAECETYATVTPKPNGHIGYLDGLRGLAILLLLEDHFIGFQPFGFFDTGRVGLDIFFALSGFLIAGLLYVKEQPLSKFYKRRISRVIPAFLIFVVSIFVYSAIVGIAFSGTEFISTLFFLRTYLPGNVGIWETPVPIGHIWSLNVEEHTYLFMSLFVLVSIGRKFRGTVLIASGIGCLVISVVYAKLGTNAPHWAGLGSETVAAHILVSGGYRLVLERLKLNVPAVVPILSFLLAIPLYTHFFPWWGRFLTPFLIAITVNHLSQTFAAVKSFMSIRAFQQMGIWSYSIYLWQQPFQIADGTFSQTGIRLGLTMILALFSFYILENPARNWLNQNW